MAKAANSAPALALKGSNGAPISVDQVPLDDLKAYDKHARSHPASQISKIAASIREFGFVVPVLVDKDNVIIAGHACVLAAKEAGLRLVPVMRAEHLSDKQVRALRLHLNRVAQEGSWLDDILKDELSALKELDFDLSLTGFDDKELQRLMIDEAALERAEETPPVPEIAVTVAGDVWVLGKHRLVCGDSTVPTDVAKALNGITPHLMVTDPPYGVQYDANWRNEPEKLNLKSNTALGGVGAKNRNATTGKVLNDDRADWTEAWSLYPGDVAYVWHGERQGPDLVGHFRSVGFEPRNLIIWAKDGLVISRGHYHPQHEGCWYLVRKGKTGHWEGDRKQSTLWKIAKNRKNETGHSTQKPVECMLRPIQNNSSHGHAIFDPFLGSGTTLIAAEMSGRSCHGLELSPNYADVIVQRWQDFANGTATLEGDGRTFDEIKAERLKAKDAA